MFKPTQIPDVVEVTPKRFGDERGFFSETYNKAAFLNAGIDIEFVQDNHSLSRDAGVLRGLHYQTPPFAQDKLVRVLQGAIYDVAVDIRQNSPTFGKWVGLELTAGAGNQLLVPAGFAHGFLTLKPDTEVAYKVSAGYAPDNDAGIAFDDPDIAIDWPGEASTFTLSDKDQVQPRLRDIVRVF